MTFSPDTEAVLNFLDEYYNNSMRKRDDIGVILEYGAAKHSADKVNRLIFVGKSVWNLYRKAKTIATANNPIVVEMERNLSDMKKYLSLIIFENGDDAIDKRFTEIYFDDKSGSLLNMIDLAHDLSLIKDLQTKNREGSLFDNSEPLS